VYVHHDLLLPAFPLALAWMSCDPSGARDSANMVAIGTMEQGGRAGGRGATWWWGGGEEGGAGCCCPWWQAGLALLGAGQAGRQGAGEASAGLAYLPAPAPVAVLAGLRRGSRASPAAGCALARRLLGAMLCSLSTASRPQASRSGTWT
jgi:hypothetical protein